MHRILPIYKLTLRSIFRERVALSMLALLGLVLFLLPAGLESDGTVQGTLRMQIRYSLGVSSFLLAAMTVWVSSASIAGDLSSKRLQMILTKPVHRAEIWWGKWLAVVSWVTCLALLCGGVTYLRIRSMIHASDLDAEAREVVFTQQLTSRRAVDPHQEDLGEEAERLAREQIQSGSVPPGIPLELVVKEMERFLRVSRNAASAGEQVSWTFDLTPPLQEGQTVQLAYQYDGSSMGVGTVPGRWRIGLPDEAPRLEFTRTETPYGEKVIPFQIGKDLSGAHQLVISYENTSESSSRVFFKTDQGVRLYFEGGTFLMNLFRGLLIISGLLAILAAIGVSAGSCFSLPGACYVSAAVLLLQGFSGVVEEVLDKGIPPAEEQQSALNRSFQVFQFQVYKGVHLMIQPLQMEAPLSRVSRGVQIPPAELFRTLALHFTPVILVISGTGIFVFHRRETGGAV
ncbi:MAG: hypothetical protein ACO3NW_03180 [Kiritimatiellia bacterium]